MGVIGYIVKLSEFYLFFPGKQSEVCSAQARYSRKLTECFLLLVHIPVNNILVGGA
jgi:hypothetical protein